MKNAVRLIAWNDRNASDPFFGRLVMELMNTITSRAAAGSSRLAVGITYYSDFVGIYGLAQCTRDLSEASCNQCLSDLFGSLRMGWMGGRVFAVSCLLRFETAPFFSLSVVPPAPPPSTPPESSGGGNSTGGIPGSDGKKNSGSKVVIIVLVSVVIAVIFLFVVVICLKRRPIKGRRPMQRVLSVVVEQPLRSAESLLFDSGTLRTATGNFSDANKLGKGGFGPVYKGVLPDGQQIAVKRLSGGSRQGLTELRNEVALVAKLQHRNLVRLMGFCLEEEEKMVVYEYLPNTSLDKILFDPVKRLQLGWGRRFKLVEGIARGLVYLHEDSRLRIIHRDLKVSNILLDEHMNPKISDFGLAKLFGVDESHGNTTRIAGTPGYMAPEYVNHGHFSTKSDVFSFGILVLVIVTGRRISSFHESGSATDLTSFVWNHWNAGTALQLLDQSVGEQFQSHELLRCIHIGLLCVQEDPSERPNMSSVALMLGSFSVTLPSPSRPAFLIGGRSALSNPGMHQRNRGSSSNQVTISDLEPR